MVSFMAGYQTAMKRYTNAGNLARRLPPMAKRHTCSPISCTRLRLFRLLVNFVDNAAWRVE